MKKICLMIITVLGIILIPKSVYASNKVTIYIFRGSTCAHCEEAINYIHKHEDEIDPNIEILTYEVWDNKTNASLEEAVAKNLGVDTTDNFGVPFIVIGKDYIKGYSDSSTFDSMISKAKSYIDNDEYEDIVKKTIKEEGLTPEALKISDIFSEPNKMVTIIIYVVFGLIILGFIGMIVFSRRK